MKPKDCFKEIPIAGPCPVDREKMEKGFNCLCRIYRFGHPSIENVSEYTFLEFTPKAKRKLRLTISEDDAKWIIQNFSLCEIPTRGYNNSVYVPQIVF